MLNYFTLVIWNYKNDKNHSFTFYIELCTKSVGVGLNFALLKEPPIFVLKGIMIVHEIKQIFKIFNLRFFIIYFTLKTKLYF